MNSTVFFTRLTSNTNDWITPSGHFWKKSNQGKPNIPYENQFGYGHEEWLLNPRYRVGGFQYGYIRGIKSSNYRGQTIERVYLYTVDKTENNNFVYYLGYFNNVEGLNEDWEDYHKDILKVLHENAESVLEEVKKINGDISGLKKDPFYPIVRFKVEDIKLLEKPLYLEEFPLNQYKRFQPYTITDEILELFEGLAPKETDDPVIFTPGKAKQTKHYIRSLSESERSIEKEHSKIVDKLEYFIKQKYHINEKNLSVELTRFKGNIADIVIRNSEKSITIYEVKTSLIIRKNVREALAQLLDYASHSIGYNIESLVIVSPHKLDHNTEQFLKSLNSKIDYNIKYMSYLEDDSQSHFIEYPHLSNSR
jgi:hypothetical protein